MNFNLKDIVELDRRTPSHVANSILRGGKGTVSALHIDGVTVTFWKESLAFPTAKRELWFSYDVNTVRPTKYLNNTSVSLATEVQKLPELKVVVKGTFGEFSEGDRVQLKSHSIKGIPKSGATGVIEEIGPINVRVLFDKTYKSVYGSTCQRLRLPYPYPSSTNAGMNINLLEKVQEFTEPEVFNYDFREGDKVVMRAHDNPCIVPPGTVGTVTFSISGGKLRPYFSHNSNHSRRLITTDEYATSRGINSHTIHPSLVRITERGPEFTTAPVEYNATLSLLNMNLSIPPRRSSDARLVPPRLVLRAGMSDTSGKSVKIKVNAGYGVTELVLDMDPEAVVALITALAEALA